MKSMQRYNRYKELIKICMNSLLGENRESAAWANCVDDIFSRRLLSFMNTLFGTSHMRAYKIRMRKIARERAITNQLLDKVGSNTKGYYTDMVRKKGIRAFL